MAAIYWFSSNCTNTSNLTRLSIFQVCLCEQVLRQNAAELSWVDAPPLSAPLAHPASSYYKRKYFLAGHMPFIDFSLFALLDLTDQMGHLMLGWRRRKTKTKQGWDSSWIYQSSWALCFQFNKELPFGKGVIVWDLEQYGVLEITPEVSSIKCSQTSSLGYLYPWLYYLLKVLMRLEPCDPVWTINRCNLGAFHDFKY